ncbi:MAG: penicillin-binding protein 2 [Gammaproteobacteria bacterium]|nr:penicillin-binding protein 2 [Gammaproteobacteria bacterium]
MVINLDQRDFLQDQGDARYLRNVSIPANRGVIHDRNGEPLAISTPMESIWVNPKRINLNHANLPQLAKFLNINLSKLKKDISDRKGREFYYLSRQQPPALAEKIMALRIDGIATEREYYRFYPLGEVVAHLIGFTNIDGVGQEGAELMMEPRLRGHAGSKRVLKDRLGNIVENLESINQPRNGDDLYLSIDRRIQYLAYRELKAAVARNQARAGSAVVIDVRTGEVLAMVNQPSYNPNNRAALDPAAMRNRAVTDIYEPGSTMKPFTIALALESGLYTPETVIDTNPGSVRIAGFTIYDHRNYGVLNLSGIIQKSSNVGASQIALNMDTKHYWQLLDRFGFGKITDMGFPGESPGYLNEYQQWRRVDQAALGYGYGLSVSTLQLTQAYSVLAAAGVMHPVSLFRRDKATNKSQQVIPERISHEVIKMMELVTQAGGTATSARINGYRVAGKTGTVRVIGANGYDEENYRGLFAGITPASNPRLAMVTVIEQPQAADYYGGIVAAPVFSRVMTGALRILDIPPDNLQAVSGSATQ